MPAKATKNSATSTKSSSAKMSYEEAQKRVKNLRDFYMSLATYIVFVFFFLGLDFFVSGGITWSVWPIFGWGIGMFFYGVTTFVWNSPMGKQWEDKKIKELMGEE
jgi:hypothetical protein